MNDDEIRKLVRTKLTNGSLQRQIPVIAQVNVVPGQPTQILATIGSFPDPCAVCADGRPTQCRYGPGLAFHERCHAIWLEEIGPRRQ